MAVPRVEQQPDLRDKDAEDAHELCLSLSMCYDKSTRDSITRAGTMSPKEPEYSMDGSSTALLTAETRTTDHQATRGPI